MPNKEINIFSQFRETQSNQTDLIVENSISIQPNKTQFEEFNLPDNALIVIPLSFMLAWTFVTLVCSDFWSLTRYSFVTAKQAQKLPCQNCQFFKNNPYLQCAVRPALALTSEARNCSDYLPGNQRS
jgi:hypothetical protein